MRLAAVDARHTIDATRTLQILASLNATRVFLFGAAARALAAALDAEDRAARDRFLDESARFLLGSEGAARPRRNAPSPLLARAVAVVQPGTQALPLLATTDRAVEMRGASLVMAVPRRDLLATENLENASLWIVGGATERELVVNGASVVVAPGPLDEGGAILVCEPEKSGFVVESLAKDGASLGRQSLAPVAQGPRFSVRG